MPIPILQSATHPPVGWRVTLITRPSAPSDVLLGYRLGATLEFVRVLTPDAARALAAHLREAQQWLGDAPGQRSSFLRGEHNVVYAGGWPSSRPLTLRLSGSQLDGHGHQCFAYQLTRPAADKLAGALEEVLALFDPPRSELPAGLDANPERNLPPPRPALAAPAAEYLLAGAGYHS